MFDLRTARLREVYEAVDRAARFREPQRRSFQKVLEIFESLHDDLSEVPQDDLVDRLRGLGYAALGEYPDFQFALATGVGKRKLMGGIAAFLIASRQSSNVLVLASRNAILDKLERELTPASPDYLFLDTRIVPSPNICLRSNVSSFRPSDREPNVFLLSPQSITGGGRRIAEVKDFRDKSLLDYLRECRDLVVLTDEAHHIGDVDSAWRRAVSELEPRIHFGFSATPRSDAEILWRYDLAQCLREGLYTKAVKLLVDTRDDGISDEDWDHATIDYALGRQLIKQAVIDDYASTGAFPPVRAVVLLAARDIPHAVEVGQWLVESRGFEADEVLVTHSKKSDTEADVAALVAIDEPTSKVRVVVHVDRLSEGWDVTNVYVIAPLRAMASYQLAIQTLGRGLRLPAGRRVGVPELDTLDVVLFGRDTANDIYEEAKRDFRDPDLDASSITVEDAQSDDEPDAQPRKRVNVTANSPVELPMPVLYREIPPVDLAFEIDVPNRLMRDLVRAIGLGKEMTIESADDDGVAYDPAYLVSATRARVCSQLEYLDEFTDGEAIDRLTNGVLAQVRAGDEESALYVDPLRLAGLIVSEISRRRAAVPPTFTRTERTRLIAVEDVQIWILEDCDRPIPPSDVTER